MVNIVGHGSPPSQVAGFPCQFCFTLFQRRRFCVFSNRIAKHMRLDCDPTTIYAALLDNRYTGVIHKSDLLNQNPYNTYQKVGAPPGPIANAGAAALEAALHPATTDYLFFVAKAEGGGHVFSATRAAHEKAVLAYRHAKHKAG